MFKVLPIHRRTLDRLLHVDRVFWMNAFENKFHRRFRRSVILEDPRGFLGPADLTGRNAPAEDRKSTRLNSSHVSISYAVFCLKKKKIIKTKINCYRL